MAKYLLMLVAVVVGMGIPLQGAINAQMGKALQNPLLATLVSFTGGLLAISLILLLTTPGLPTWGAPRSTPWYLYCGGLPGVVFVTTTLLSVSSNRCNERARGDFWSVSFLRHSRLITFGWMGVRERPITSVRVVGVFLLIGGMLLVAYGEKAKQPAVSVGEEAGSEG